MPSKLDMAAAARETQGMTITSILAAAALASCPITATAEFDGEAYLASADRDGLHAMVACLESPDPAIRDERAYSAFAAALRGGSIDTARRGDLLDMLVEQIVEAKGDPNGFRGPFAALVLAELARTDRIDPWLDEGELGRFVQLAAIYLGEVDDYRGFAPGEGWRHGVAHGADLMMQLALNPRVNRTMGLAMLDAIKIKVAPDGHAYRFGEPARLARPVLFLARRGVLRDEDLAGWFEGLHPPVDGDWSDRYSHAGTLTRIHNLRGFALEIYVGASRWENSRGEALAELALGLMQATAGP